MGPGVSGLKKNSRTSAVERMNERMLNVNVELSSIIG